MRVAEEGAHRQLFMPVEFAAVIQGDGFSGLFGYFFQQSGQGLCGCIGRFIGHSSGEQLDIEPQEIGRNYPTEIGVVADARSALYVLNRVARQRYPDGFNRAEKKAEIAAFRADFKAANARMQTASDFPMMPERILALPGRLGRS